jgi:hypothetical protein
MNYLPFKLRRMLVLISLSAIPFASIAYAQEQESAPSPEQNPASAPAPGFDLDISDGAIRIDAPSSALSSRASYVPATIKNVAEILRALRPDLNLVVSPEAEEITVDNLKLRSADARTLMEAIGFATGGRIRAQPFGDPSERLKSFALTVARPRTEPQRKVEVFNLSGYLRQSRAPEEIDEKLQVVQEIIDATIRAFKGEDFTGERPAYRFYPDAQIFIVIGRPDEIEVARKVINALPGQQVNPAEIQAIARWREAIANRLIDAKTKLAGLKVDLTENNPTVKSLLAQINELERQLREATGLPQAPAAPEEKEENSH